KEELLYYLLSPKFLDLIILPTEKCNFRCRYCYESFSIGKMGQQVVNGIVNLIKARAPSLDLLTIHFFGGEPLLAHSHIVQICRASMAAMEMGKFSYYAMATTNGYLLTQERADLYYSIGLKRYQITFDGTKNVHDLWRAKYGGGGTFDTIWSNLKGLRALPHDLDVLVRLHLMPGR
ncbi:MAG: radical SAM protein, partial [Caldilineae bacterium]